ncbi:MAG TPA: DNA polymerase I, partial [Limnochordia bacterium]
ATVDPATLEAEKGIRPEQVIDFLTLIGDSVDNIPGVPGVGPKTAAQLLQAFGSVEEIFAHLDQIGGKRRERLIEARPRLELTRALITLKRDAEFPFSLAAARVTPPDPDRLLPFFQELGFRRFQGEVRRVAAVLGAERQEADGAAAARAEVAAAAIQPASVQVVRSTSYRAITTAAELDELVQTLSAQPIIAVDTETTGLGRDSVLCGLSFAWEPGSGVYVPVRSPEPARHLDAATVLTALRPVLENPELGKCGHNLKFDVHALRTAGVALRGLVFDSMLASLLLDPEQPGHKLEQLALAWLDYEMIPITALIGEGPDQRPMDSVPLEQIVPYAAEDADVALRLYRHLAPELEARGMARLLCEVEAPLAAVVAEMEANGIRCDPDELTRQGEELAARVAALRDEIMAIAGCEFHLDSPRQLAEVLFDRLGLPEGKRTKTGRSTDIEVLSRLAAEEDPSDPRTSLPRLVIEYRQLTKLLSTYLGTLRAAIDPRTGRIHSTFHQLLTATGRLASHNPNLQNIPVRTDVGRQIRKAFVAEPGCALICADYSQVELRILAHLSRDPGLIDAFARGIDIHAAVAAEVFGAPLDGVTREQRARAKTINFGIIYGITPFGLSRRIEGLDVAAATRLIAEYKARFPGIEAFLQACVRQAAEEGFVTTLLGRRRAIPQIHSRSRPVRQLGERLAINSVVQGSAADLIKVAMVKLQRRIEQERLPLKLLLQIHDELVLEAPAESAAELAELVREEMEQALELSVPLKAEAGIGPDWMSAK